MDAAVIAFSHLLTFSCEKVYCSKGNQMHFRTCPQMIVAINYIGDEKKFRVDRENTRPMDVLSLFVLLYLYFCICVFDTWEYYL